MYFGPSYYVFFSFAVSFLVLHSLLGEKKTNTDYNTDDGDGENEHAPLFRNGFPVNSNFEFRSMDK